MVPMEQAGCAVDMEADSESEGLCRAVSTYAALLGPRGLLEYRRLVEMRRSGGGRTSRVLDGVHEAVLEELADNYELIALLDAKGRVGDRVRIVELLTGEGRHEEPIERGRRWLANDGVSGKLRDLVATLLCHRGDDSDALMLYVRAFEEGPSAEAYQELISQPGVDSDEWYEACHATVAARSAEPTPDSRRRARRDAVAP